MQVITREELINNPNSWISTENLNLNVFDHIQKNIGGSYFLKKKNSGSVFFGHYEPRSKSFECYKLQEYHQIIIKRENIGFFISLPPLL
jgi:hypothetical protein